VGPSPIHAMPTHAWQRQSLIVAVSCRVVSCRVVSCRVVSCYQSLQRIVGMEAGDHMSQYFTITEPPSLSFAAFRPLYLNRKVAPFTIVHDYDDDYQLTLHGEVLLPTPACLLFLRWHSDVTVLMMLAHRGGRAWVPDGVVQGQAGDVLRLHARPRLPRRSQVRARRLQPRRTPQAADRCVRACACVCVCVRYAGTWGSTLPISLCAIRRRRASSPRTPSSWYLFATQSQFRIGSGNSALITFDLCRRGRRRSPRARKRTATASRTSSRSITSPSLSFFTLPPVHH
jgi:hypothetical protein